MEYKYAPQENYEDFASGRVFYQIKDAPNFPVRLAREIYGRCLAYSTKKTGICLYDCCCGSGYLLTVLGFLNPTSIAEIIGSDIDAQMLTVARDNLFLLSKKGLEKRQQEIRLLSEQYHKESHRAAESSAVRLMNLIQTEISVTVFQANVLQSIGMEKKPDIILTDVPYGNLVDWQGGADGVNRLLEVLKGVCYENTIVAICMDKKQKISHADFKRLEKQSIGKRKFEILQLAPPHSFIEPF